jgi:hypothetical protein
MLKRMFDNKKIELQRKLMKVVEKVNQKFGRDADRFASVERFGAWKMKQIFKSLSYNEYKVK